MEALVKRWQRKGPVTAALGTAYTLFIESGDMGRAIINRLAILNLATVHTLSVMQVLGFLKTAEAAASGQAVFKGADAYQTALAIVTGDWVAVQLFDGSFQVGTVTVGASAGGLQTYTLSANLSKAVNAGAKVFWFDLPATHEQVTVPISTTTVWESDYGVFGASEIGNPLLLHVNNITAASILQSCVCPQIAV